ncbi:NADP-specific glutamate dehydrogenase [Aerococcaceae bacterium DSM 111020]|nr:NADP-specific glutamate dehydrogenase [Aerococcaceae bacterium DSM 111020]
MSSSEYIEQVMHDLEDRYPGQSEYLQAVHEVYESIQPVLEAHPEYQEQAILERIATPERLISFRVTWQDDEGQVHVNNGYRVQHSSVNGPYKGGTRFDSSVNPSILKFLAFEQTFKNSLTGLALGGGKGGADFNPIGRSDAEIMRFCQAYMTELAKYISADQDIPAGDIGVGHREIGYLYGQYKRLQGVQLGVLTGKPVIAHGSLGRSEATGYGVMYFTEELIKSHDDSLQDKRVLISGTGAVGLHAIVKAIQLGAKVVAVSNTSGTLADPDGLDLDTLLTVIVDPNSDLVTYLEAHDTASHYKEAIWSCDIEADIAIPCAIQNEINAEQAQEIIERGIRYVIEGANMPSTAEAVQCFRDNDIIFAPAKAANAGGVAVSGLEMSQNAQRLQWTFEEVDQQLQSIMKDIFQHLLDTCEEYDLDHDYAKAANIYAFKRIAELVQIQGVV